MNGFPNLGNTCYFNSVLQMLVNLKELQQYFRTDKYKEDIVATNNDNAVLAQWTRVITTYSENRNVTINPVHLLKAMAAVMPHYMVANQKDSAECLADIFDCLHKALKYPIQVKVSGTIYNELDQQMLESLKAWQTSMGTDYSIITKLFYGQYQSHMKCGNCNNTTVRYDTFFTTALPIDGCTTLDQAIAKFCQVEIISDEWKCDECNTVATLTKQLCFWKMPPLLILTLQRFDNTNQKKGHLINYPTNNLDLSQYVQGYDKSNCTYDLCNVICHGGGTNSGHYNDIVLHDNKWFVADDTAISKVGSAVTKNAYILVYRRNN